uniref:Uncharacterized protein n=1 Tax=Chenopodium quinoa TaxID=63459 RepID=A0A803KSB2_CHEQI
MKNSVFLVIEELMMKLKEVAKVAEMVSIELLGFVNWVSECVGVGAGDAVRWRAAGCIWWMVVEMVVALWGREVVLR